MSALTGTGYYRTMRRPGFLQRILKGWTSTDLFYGFFLISILFSVIIEIRYDAAASSLARATLGDAVLEGASGSALRQLNYFGTFILVTAFSAVMARGIPRMPISIPYNLACLWCLISWTWAIAPGISFRRALGMYIILLAVGFCVQGLGARKTLKALYGFLACLIVVSFASAILSSISIFSFAVHPPDEIDQSLVGAWRGIMMHKNVAGAVMIHASIFFFHHALNRRKLLDWFFFALAITFLVMTKSKTSIGWCAFVLMAGIGYRFLVMRRASLVFVLLVGFFLFAGVTLGYVLSDQVYAFFTNPLNLSGRIEIWQSLFPYIEQHPVLGSGYGSFWAIGTSSPIFRYALTEFITQIGHSHSGYIEILLTTGIVGLTLAIIALLIVPFYRFARPLHGDALLNPMLFSIWLFGMLQNLSESQFFSPDKQSWIFVVIAITIVHTRWKASLRGDRKWLERTSWMAYRPRRLISRQQPQKVKYDTAFS